MADEPKATLGVQGESEAAPLAGSRGGHKRSAVSDTATARCPKEPATKHRGSDRLDTRYGAETMAAIRTRAKRLGLDRSAWVRAVVRDALDKRRTAEVDAAVAALTADAIARAHASADARELAAQVRPLAINVNDLDRRARQGQSVSLGEHGEELVHLLREVRALLGDRMAS